MRKRRNKRKQRIRKNADNRFTELTGIPVYRLTGTSACWICPQINTNFLPTKKVAYAALNDWQKYEMSRTSKRMKLLRVKQSCGVDQCVNPEHLIGTEKPFRPWE